MRTTPTPAADAASSSQPVADASPLTPKTPQIDDLAPALGMLSVRDGLVYFRTARGLEQMPVDGAGPSTIVDADLDDDASLQGKYVISTRPTGERPPRWQVRYGVVGEKKQTIASFPYPGRFVVGADAVYFADPNGCEGLQRIARKPGAKPAPWIPSGILPPCSATYEVRFELHDQEIYALMDGELRTATENVPLWVHVHRAEAFAVDEPSSRNYPDVYLVVSGRPSAACSAIRSILRVGTARADDQRWVLRDDEERCDIRSPTVDGAHVYWSDPKGGIFRVAKGGGRAERVVEDASRRGLPCAPDGDCAMALARGGPFLFWIDTGDHRLRRARVEP